jgi:protein-L-isoaspartate O-methyltransferase
MPKVGKKRARVHGTGPVPTGARGGKGQHFLRNMSVVQRIVDKAAIKNTDTVLEIGPGTGIMTVCMLERAKRVICVELDPRMIVLPFVCQLSIVGQGIAVVKSGSK